jgi:hypothetical protein
MIYSDFFHRELDELRTEGRTGSSRILNGKLDLFHAPNTIQPKEQSP